MNCATNGNITSITNPDPPESEVLETHGTYTYQMGTNKLTHIEGTPPIDFGYDENGNITTENTWTYAYDLSNQLVRVLDGTNEIAEYTYNGAGQRIKKVTPTETRIFHYDLQGHLIAETNQTGQMLAEYVYLGDQLLAMIKAGEAVYYYHNDHLGTPQILTDDAQTIAWKAVYTPFGEAFASIQTVENPFRFPGQYYDSETGLHYNYFRYYDPTTGRYITPDPIGLEGGINLFVYVANNPANFIDPWGLQQVLHRLTAGQLPDIRTQIAMRCLANCLGRDIIVTGARETGPPHVTGSAHETGQACDLGRSNNPQLTRSDVEWCFNQCRSNGFVWGYEGVPGFHLQTRPGGGGATGFAPGIIR